MARRDIYLKIERIAGYCPVAPGDEMGGGRRDCLRNDGHDDAHVPDAEAALRRLDALVYREYLDAGYSTPNMVPLIAVDINEPMFDYRIPGALIYAEPGDRLYVHVLNADDSPHSFHVHGVHYGIDSDGVWPLGVKGGRQRSDEICPGDSWTYVLDVTEDSIGAWPFHDHCRMVTPGTNRGLFGGLVVRDPEWEESRYRGAYLPPPIGRLAHRVRLRQRHPQSRRYLLDYTCAVTRILVALSSTPHRLAILSRELPTWPILKRSQS